LIQGTSDGVSEESSAINRLTTEMMDSTQLTQ